MIHRKLGRDGLMTASGPDPLKDALDLQERVRVLRALLELQRWQVEVLNKRLHPPTPAGIAARRLLAIKHAEMKMPDLKIPKGVNDP